MWLLTRRRCGSALGARADELPYRLSNYHEVFEDPLVDVPVGGCQSENR
jgi:hypothetical protein